MKQILCGLMLFSAVGLMAQKSRIDIQGHRGARGLYPENTIPAFIGAVKLGVNTLELDVVITKDNQVLVSHDPYMNDGFCRQVDGKSLTGDMKKDYNIYTMTYAETQAYDCGQWGNEKFPDQQKLVAHKPLLADMIDSVEDYIRKNNLPKVKYNIEIKCAPAGDNIMHPLPEPFAKLVYEVVKKKGIQDHCNIQSFDVRCLQEIHKLDPKLPIAILIADANNFKKNIEQLGFTPYAYSPHYILVNKKLVKQCHAAGVKLIPWTVNDEKKMVALKDLGIDGIITDYPNKAIQLLR